MTNHTTQRVRKAIFPVAGLGTRFLPATKAIPKEMLPVVDRPLLQHGIEEARAAGIEDFLFITGRNKRAIEDHFDVDAELNNTLREQDKIYLLDQVKQAQIPEGRLFYTRQQSPLGLGHAVWCAREFVRDEPFALLLPDDFIIAQPSCLSQMMTVYERLERGNILAVSEVAADQTHHYGIVDIAREEDRLAIIKDVIEKPSPEEAPSRLAIIGRYILQPEIFTYLEEACIGKGNEIQLTDSIAQLLKVQSVYGYRFHGERYDCGNQRGYVAANVAYALKHPETFSGLAETLRSLMEGSKE